MISSDTTLLVYSLNQDPGGKCDSLSLRNYPFGRDLRVYLSTLDNIPISSIGISIDGIAVNDDIPISSFVIENNISKDSIIMVRSFIVSGVCGGKGGFGAQLKSLAKMKGKKKTTDFGACRDLSGRRLRHINDEIVLNKWKEAKESGKEFDVEQETASGVDLWFLGVPSWADNVKPDKRKRWMKPRMKTSICLDWLRARQDGAFVPDGAPIDWGCPRGQRCEFAHGEEQLRGKSLELLLSNRKDAEKEEQMKKRDDYMDVLYRSNRPEDQVQELVLAGMRAAKKNKISSEAAISKGPEEVEVEEEEELGTDGQEELYLAFLEKYSLEDETDKIKDVDSPEEKEDNEKDIGWLIPATTASHLQIRGSKVRGKCLFGSAVVDQCRISLKGESDEEVFYYEVSLLTDGLMQLGWADNQFASSEEGGDGVGDDGHSWGFDGLRNKKWHYGEI